MVQFTNNGAINHCKGRDEGESQVEFFLHIQIVYVHCPKGNARSQQWPKVGVIIHGLLTDDTPDPFSLMVRFTDILTFGF